ncbi:AIPR family protein [Paraclostridium bifermentans]|uniref:AIPR family protein n=1 Tax=Paraclostridium bifermentans TaxID=1490 RepID=UPI001C810332|nr:AIPR family protein [Paraclostridium bifermentans]GIM31531.1 hypothetical protein PAGU1678_08010 [Paraclostridium bifermentans subsp. muricolitidis]
MQKINFKNVNVLKKMDNPNSDSIVSYEFYCPVLEISEDIPLERTNPRFQHMGSKSQLEIEGSLLSKENNLFHILNKGMAISASDIKYDNKSKEVTIYLADEDIHGDIDGGHTYRTILKYKNDPAKKQILSKKYVKIEILIGLDEETLPLVAKARNTSIPVKDTTIAELENKFEIIKQSLKDIPFFKRVAFKQFEEKDDITKDLLIRNIISIYNLFNIKKYGSENHPVVSYSANQTTVQYYMKEYDEYPGEDNAYSKMSYISPDFFTLHSKIERDFISSYNKNGKKYGSLSFAKNVNNNSQRVKYSVEDEYLTYKIPEGLVLPILASLRALIDEKEVEIDGKKVCKYVWKYDPYEYVDKLLDQMTRITSEKLKQNGSNPQSLGKDSSHWLLLYTLVERERMCEELKELKELKENI